jgi:transposase-like protein
VSCEARLRPRLVHHVERRLRDAAKARKARRGRHLWIEQTEGAKFRLKVMNKLKTRGVGDILIAVVDGLSGFPEADGAVFPGAG